MRRVFVMLLAVAGMAMAAAPAEAHTNAFGFIPQANGDVTFYIGTYTSGHSSFPIEGSLVISGGTGAGSYAFTAVHTSTSAAALGLTAPGATYTSTGSSGTTANFQSVTVSGLVDGVYIFDISGMTSFAWERDTGDFPWPNTAAVNVISDVPEPTSMALFGLTALGMGIAVRRRRKTGSSAKTSEVS